VLGARVPEESAVEDAMVVLWGNGVGVVIVGLCVCIYGGDGDKVGNYIVSLALIACCGGPTSTYPCCRFYFQPGHAGANIGNCIL